VDLNSNNQAVIKWSVSQQSNNKGYYVEQSADGVNWETLAFIPNDYNKGGSAKYSFLQNKPVNGRHFYRIRQEDLDGNTSYSEIKIIDIKSDIHVELSPNPATDHIVIRIENPNGIQSNKAALFDFSGKLIAAQAIKAGVNQIDISSFPKGSYFLKIVTGEGVVYHERFIKQ